jgi:hypothetical protein
VFETPTTASASGLQALLVAASFLFVGYLVAAALTGRKVDGITKLGLALPGVVLLALTAQGIHIVSGGRLFASSLATRAFVICVVIALLVVWIARRPAGSPPERRLIFVALGLALLAVAIWGYPLFRDLPLDTGGDSALHAGYAAQLMNGEPLPSGPITGSIPNFYPWMSHGVIAMLAHFMPGGRSYHAAPALQVLQVAGLVLSLVALGVQLAAGRLERTSIGAATALMCGICGGIGFLALQGIDVIPNPHVDTELYLGDLLQRRSYNFSFFSMVPMYPRDIAAALLVAFLVALVFGLRHNHTRSLVTAGIILGLAGLTGAEAFFVGTGVLIVLLLVPTGVSRRRLSTPLLIALAMFSLWLVPQLIGYLDLGGYVNLTIVDPVVLSPVGVLGGWGITTPLAIYGVSRVAGRLRGDVGTRVLLVLVAVGTAAVIFLPLLPVLLGEAFESLGRAHRYWPLLHLGIALLAAVGLADILARIFARSRSLAMGLGILVAAAAVTSPIVASVAYARDQKPGKFVAPAVRGESGTLLNLIAPETGKRCNVAVPLSIEVATWSYTGYRLVHFAWPFRRENLARIRWRDIYERIPGDYERSVANMTLLSGRDTAQWQRTADRFDVDIVVTDPAYAEGPSLGRFESAIARDFPLAVVQIDDCDRPG